MSSELRRPHRTGSPERGASLVEFALILPIFAMLVFGGITAGFALNDKQQMTHATREGARYAATVPANQVFDNGEDWADNVRDLIVERSSGTLDDSAVCVSLVEGTASDSSLTVVDDDDAFSTKGDPGDPEPCIADQDYPIAATIDDGRRVQVTATRQAEIDLVVFGAYPVTMDVEATALSEPAE